MVNGNKEFFGQLQQRTLREPASPQPSSDFEVLTDEGEVKRATTGFVTGPRPVDPSIPEDVIDAPNLPRRRIATEENTKELEKREKTLEPVPSISLRRPLSPAESEAITFNPELKFTTNLAGLDIAEELVPASRFIREGHIRRTGRDLNEEEATPAFKEALEFISRTSLKPLAEVRQQVFAKRQEKINQANTDKALRLLVQSGVFKDQPEVLKQQSLLETQRLKRDIGNISLGDALESIEENLDLNQERFNEGLSIPEGVAAHYKTGSLNVQISKLRAREVLYGEDHEREVTDLKLQLPFIPEQKRVLPREAVEGIIEQIPLFASIGKQAVVRGVQGAAGLGATGTIIGFGFGNVLGALAGGGTGVRLGFKTGTALGATEQTFHLTTGEAYEQFLSSGLPKNTSQDLALAVGALNAGLELVGIGTILRGFTGIGLRTVKGSGTKIIISSLLKNKVLLKRMLQLGSQISGRVATPFLAEGFTEYYQELTTLTAAEMFKQYEKGAKDLNLNELVDALALPENQKTLNKAFRKGALVGGGLGTVSASVHAGVGIPQLFTEQQVKQLSDGKPVVGPAPVGSIVKTEREEKAKQDPPTIRQKAEEEIGKATELIQREDADPEDISEAGKAIVLAEKEIARADVIEVASNPVSTTEQVRKAEQVLEDAEQDIREFTEPQERISPKEQEETKPVRAVATVGQSGNIEGLLAEARKNNVPEEQIEELRRDMVEERAELGPEVFAREDGGSLNTGQPVSIETFRGFGRKKGEGVLAPGVEENALGEARYSAISEKVAKGFGPKVEKLDIQLDNPFILDSDKKLRELFGGRDIPFANEERIPLLRQARESLEASGHDGVIINVPQLADMNNQGDNIKRIREIFDVSQVVEFSPPEKIKKKVVKKPKPKLPEGISPERLAELEEQVSSIQIGGKEKFRIIGIPGTFNTKEAAIANAFTEGSSSRKINLEDGHDAFPESIPTPLPQQKKPLTEKEIREKVVEKRKGFNELVPELARIFEIPIRVGKFREKALGIFKRREETIRTKLAFDMQVIAHEIGHGAGKKLGFNDINNYDNELIPLGQKTSRPSYDNAQRRREGIAEFFRLYLNNDAGLLQAAPQFYKAFNFAVAQNKQWREAIAFARTEYRKILAYDPIDFMSATIAWDPKRDRDMTRTDEFIINWLDDLYPVLQFTRNVYEGNTPTMTKDVYKLLRIERGAQDRGFNWVQNGIRDLSGTKINNGLSSLFKKLRKKKLISHFEVYLKAKREVSDLIPRNLIPDKLEVAAATESVKSYEIAFPEFIEFQKEIAEFTDGLLAVATTEGVVTFEEAIRMKLVANAYIPFHRVIDDAVGGTFTGTNSKAFAKFTGTRNEATIPSLEALIQNTFSIAQAVGRQRIYRALDAAASQEGMGKFIERLPGPRPRPTNITIKELSRILKKKGFVDEKGEAILDETSSEILEMFNLPGRYGMDEPIISYVINGKRRYMRVQDQFLYNTLTGSPAGVADLQITWMKAMAKVLRIAATTSIGFITRNPTRDTIEAGIQTKVGFIPFVDSVVGALHIIANQDTYQRFRNSGASQATFLSNDRKYLEQARKNLGKSAISRIASNTLTSPLEFLAATSEFFENSTRVGIAAKARKKGLFEGMTDEEADAYAAFASRESTIDFGRAGIKGRKHNEIRAFFNATLQGKDKFIRTFKTDPLGATIKTAMLITLPQVLAWWFLKDDKEYQELPDWEKSTRYILPMKIGGRFVSIPSPHGYGFVFGYGVTQVLDQIEGENPEALRDLKEGLKGIVKEDAMMFMLSTAALPIIEVLANYDFFREKNIINTFNEGLPVEKQFSPWTSESAKAISNALPEDVRIAPAKIDHLIYGYTAGLGRLGTDIFDSGLRWFRDETKPPLPKKNISEVVPFFRAFLSTRGASNSKSLRRFYEVSEKMKGFNRSIKTATKEEKRDLLERKEKLLKFISGGTVRSREARVKQIEKQLRAQWALVKRTYDADISKMDPNQKRRKLDELNEKIIDLARRAFGKEI